MPKRSGLCLILFTFLLAGCASPQPTLLDPPNGSAALSPVITAPAAPVSAHTRTPLPAATATTILTATVTPTPTPTLIAIAPGSPVVVPVLLFHHIAANISDIRYFVAPDDFRIQMETLKQLGYTAIPMSKLVDVIKNGGELPARPVVITFDDGTEDVYQNAFPIMKEMDMTGALYIVANRLGIKDFLSVAEIKEMIASSLFDAKRGPKPVEPAADPEKLRKLL